MRLVITLMVIVVLFLPSTALAQKGRWGQKRTKGPKFNDPAFQADREIFHYLLTHRGQIRRTVKNLKNGVETVTESDNPTVALVIQKHVESMHKRVKNGSPIHMRDPLFRAIFSNWKKIKMKVQKTKRGVRVIETSDDLHVAKLIRAHAQVVSLFIANGPTEVRRNHAVPPSKKQGK
ncbi:MAG: hypothetical protein ACFCD0_19300 [Gemmataceae bacterium]